MRMTHENVTQVNIKCIEWIICGWYLHVLIVSVNISETRRISVQSICTI